MRSAVILAALLSIAAAPPRGVTLDSIGASASADIVPLYSGTLLGLGASTPAVTAPPRGGVLSSLTWSPFLVGTGLGGNLTLQARGTSLGVPNALLCSITIPCTLVVGSLVQASCGDAPVDGGSVVSVVVDATACLTRPSGSLTGNFFWER